MKRAAKIPLVVLVSSAFAFSGCSTPKPKPEPTPTPEAKVEAPAKANYVVKPGDSLWKISGEDSVLGDSFRWPLLYKENRDQIQDPDLIEPKQDLGYKKEYAESEIAGAVKKAKETPKYQPHSTPRESLPVKY